LPRDLLRSREKNHHHGRKDRGRDILRFAPNDFRAFVRIFAGQHTRSVHQDLGAGVGEPPENFDLVHD
jgi:hypothetical protein